MKKVYTHQSLVYVGLARNLVEEQGISCRVFNEYASGAVGEISFIQAWPELWVELDSDYERACNIISSGLSLPDAPGWTCTACEEENDASFEWCWRCAATRPV